MIQRHNPTTYYLNPAPNLDLSRLCRSINVGSMIRNRMFVSITASSILVLLSCLPDLSIKSFELGKPRQPHHVVGRGPKKSGEGTSSKSGFVEGRASTNKCFTIFNSQDIRYSRVFHRTICFQLLDHLILQDRNRSLFIKSRISECPMMKPSRRDEIELNGIVKAMPLQTPCS